MLTARGRRTIAFGLVAGLSSGGSSAFPSCSGSPPPPSSSPWRRSCGSAWRSGPCHGDRTGRAARSSRPARPLCSSSRSRRPALERVALDSGQCSSQTTRGPAGSASRPGSSCRRWAVPATGAGDLRDSHSTAGRRSTPEPTRLPSPTPSAWPGSVSGPAGLPVRRAPTRRAARHRACRRVSARSGAESTRSAAERLVTGSSMLRRYAQGDDLRRVHWRTTARRSASSWSARAATGTTRTGSRRRSCSTPETLTDAAGRARPGGRGGRERAGRCRRRVERGRLRRLPSRDDHGSRQRGPAWTRRSSEVLDRPRRRRPGTPARRAARGSAAALERLGRPDQDEVLVVVGAFGDSPPDPVLLEDRGPVLFRSRPRARGRRGTCAAEASPRPYDEQAG